MVSVGRRKVLSEKIQANVEPPLRPSEFKQSTAVVFKDPQVIAALKGKNLTVDDVMFDYDSVGHYTGVVSMDVRVVVFEIYGKDGTNMYARPMDISVRVDIDNWVVLSVSDEAIPGGAVPTEDNSDIDPAHVPQREDPPAPFNINRPKGASFKVDGNRIAWQGWHFHIRTDWRVGASINMVRFNDTTTTMTPKGIRTEPRGMRSVLTHIPTGTRNTHTRTHTHTHKHTLSFPLSRPCTHTRTHAQTHTHAHTQVAYEMFLSEMFVPYQFDDEQW